MSNPAVQDPVVEAGSVGSVAPLKGAAAALAQVREEAMALPTSAVKPFKGMAAALIVNGLTLHRLYLRDRPLLVAAFQPDAFAWSDADQIERFALALSQAEADYQATLDPIGTLASLRAEGAPVRSKLLDSAEYLWKKKDDRIAAILARIRKGAGSLDLASDLQQTSTVFIDQWAYAKGRSEVTLADLNQANDIALRILYALKQAETSPLLTERRDLRARVAHLVTEAAAEILAGATFVHRRAPESLAEYPALRSPLKKTKKAKPALTEDKQTA